MLCGLAEPLPRSVCRNRHPSLQPVKDFVPGIWSGAQEDKLGHCREAAVGRIRPSAGKPPVALRSLRIARAQGPWWRALTRSGPVNQAIHGLGICSLRHSENPNCLSARRALAGWESQTEIDPQMPPGGGTFGEACLWRKAWLSAQGLRINRLLRRWLFHVAKFAVSERVSISDPVERRGVPRTGSLCTDWPDRSPMAFPWQAIPTCPPQILRPCSPSFVPSSWS